MSARAKQYEKAANVNATVGEVVALIEANNRTQNVGIRFAIFLGILSVMLGIGAWVFAAWVR